MATTVTTQEKVLYTAKTHTTGGRDGASRSNDGRLDVKLASPGAPGNPWRAALHTPEPGLGSRPMKGRQLTGQPLTGQPLTGMPDVATYRA